jgi:hypothetical protein
MKRLGLFALSVALLAIPMSLAAHGGHGSGGHGQGRHGSRGQHHRFHGHLFHGHGGVVAALPFFWVNDGPVYYYDPLAVYPPGAMIYDPQTGMVWVPAHFARVGDSVVWVPAHREPLRRRS